MFPCPPQPCPRVLYQDSQHGEDTYWGVLFSCRSGECSGHGDGSVVWACLRLLNSVLQKGCEWPAYLCTQGSSGISGWHSFTRFDKIFPVGHTVFCLNELLGTCISCSSCNEFPVAAVTNTAPRG